MDALEKRVAERMTLEARQGRDEQMKLGRRKQALAKEADKALGAAQKMFDVLKAGETPTKAVATAGTAALKVLSRVSRAMMTVNERMAEQAQTLATLEDPAEKARRVKHAKELGITDEPLSGVDAAEVVLIRRGKPTHVTDITREALESGLVKLSGKTPDQTMSAFLAKDVAKADGKFVRVAPGVFGLKPKAEAKAETAKS